MVTLVATQTGATSAKNVGKEKGCERHGIQNVFTEVTSLAM
jgi:hypothetical protein